MIRGIFIIVLYGLLPTLLGACSTCDNQTTERSSSKASPSGKTSGAKAKGVDAIPSIDEAGCTALAEKSAACAKPNTAHFHRRVVKRSCKRHLKDPALRPLQQTLNECAKIMSCAAYKACYDKASTPLRELYFKRARSRSMR